MNEHHANHSQNLERWRGRIQNELIDLCTGSMSIASHDNGHDFHYRHHQVNLDSGTCYIWFAIHTSNTTTDHEDDVVILLDASTETVVTRTIQVKGRTEEIVESLALYPNRPPRVQYVSGALPRGSTLSKGDFMEWQWFRGGQELEAHKWSPGLRIPDAMELLAKSLIVDYCRCQRSFPPPPPPQDNPMSRQSSWTSKICYFVCGCFSTARAPPLAAPKSKSNKDKGRAQKLLNQLNVPEPEEGENHDAKGENHDAKINRPLDNAPTSPSSSKSLPANTIGKNMGVVPAAATASCTTTAAATPNQTEPPSRDVNEFQDSVVTDSLRPRDHHKEMGAAEEEEKQEIDELVYH